MSLNSMVFIWLFLPVSLILVRAARPRYQNIFLMILSLVFWFWNDPYQKPYLPAAVLFTYVTGCLLGHFPEAGIPEGKDRTNETGTRPGVKSGRKTAARRILLFSGLTVDLGLLAAYKALHNKVTAPAALSFITFSLVSYLADVYKGDAEAAADPVDYLLYVTFFPKLLMGPIERYKNFQGQLKAENRDYSAEHLALGVRLFVIGLAKKVLIADVLAIAADKIFSNAGALQASEVWIGALCYTLQLYYDFSGYSEMAQGIGNMFGFSLTRNFDYPYMSQSITEFWRRWHITLGSWFKYYLYIPLGGNRKGKIRTYLNLFIVFLATGIWHGNGLTYLIWGIYHGIWIVIERMGLKKAGERNRFKWVNILICDFAVLIGWVLFRADSLPAAIVYLKAMFGLGASPAGAAVSAGQVLSRKLIAVLIIAVIGAGPIQQFRAKMTSVRTFTKSRVWDVIEFIFLAVVLAASILSVSSGTYSAFLYTQF